MRDRINQLKEHGRHRLPLENFSFKEADERIYEFFCNHGFEDFPNSKRHLLVKFYRLLMKNQEKYNFTRLLKIRDVTIKHFIDSLIVTRFVNLAFPLLDVGSGPGFPGIPIKIAFPDQRVILCEPVQKKVEFLKLVRDDLNLKNLDILGRKVNRSFEFPVQGVITRAVADIEASLFSFKRFLPAGGYAYFMKGPNVNSELIRAKENLASSYHFISDIEYEIPQTPHKRRLITFRRMSDV